MNEPGSEPNFQNPVETLQWVFPDYHGETHQQYLLQPTRRDPSPQNQSMPTNAQRQSMFEPEEPFSIMVDGEPYILGPNGWEPAENHPEEDYASGPHD